MPKQSHYLRVNCPWTSETLPISAHMAARYTGRSLRTAYRWAAGTGRPSPAEQAQIRAHTLGILHDNDWNDFRLRGGLLVHLPTGECWSPEQLRATWVMIQEIAALRAAMRKLRERPAAPVLRLAPPPKQTGEKSPQSAGGL